MQTLENTYLRLTISEHGAEMQSIIRKRDQQELLWQGDPAYWGRRSPVLFPLVGHAYQDQFRVGNTTYHMGQHGFARDLDFDVISHTPTTVALRLTSTDDTLERYPFPFILTITYTLTQSTISVTWQVDNPSPHLTLPFHIGAHPGFLLPRYDAEAEVHGYLAFNVTDRLVSAGLRPGGYTDPETTFDVPLTDGLLPLTNHTFDCDTILDCRNVLNSCTLLDAHRQEVLTLRFQMPILALWSPNGGQSPFVCIEPWHGCCDPFGFEGQLHERPFTNLLEPGQQFENTYEIEIG